VKCDIGQKFKYFNSVNAMCNRSGDIILDIQPEGDACVRQMLRKDAIAIRKHEPWQRPAIGRNLLSFGGKP
jgi:hypothetical protein